MIHYIIELKEIKLQSETEISLRKEKSDNSDVQMNQWMLKQYGQVEKLKENGANMALIPSFLTIIPL